MLLRDIASTRLGLAEGRVERRQIGLERSTVRVLTEARPVDALLWNLVRVVQTLESAEVDYWLVRPASGMRFVVGTRLSQRPEVVRTLAKTLAADPAVTVRTILPRPKVKQRPFDGETNGLERRLASSTVLRIIQHVAAPESERILGEEFSTEIEFWDDLCDDDSAHQFDDELIAPRPGATTRRMRTSEGTDAIPLSLATLLSPREFDSIEIEVPRSQAARLPGDVSFPIDAVYTWVDGSDPEWLRLKSNYSPIEMTHEEVDSAARYASRDELLYSLRSIHDFAPWVRNIFVVTAGQHPQWLGQNEKVKIVNHSDIFPDSRHLPTFNSHSIEANIHRIEGLSEHFLYLNDDMFFGRAVPPSLFFFGNGTAKHK
ncbi:stealth family protein, partial [Brachybacterium alimentarium]|uniref:stealth family protein n=1 Tax=Brachybacterium alimentarium TaxID=47845 RepID=UPI003FD4E930